MIVRRLRAPLALAALVGILAVTTAWASETTDTVLPVPQRSQADGTIWASSNCGPTSIAMVLEAYGIKVPANKLRDRANQLLGIADPNTGTRAQDLARILREYGLAVAGPYDDAGKQRRWSLDEVRAELRSGWPVVVQAYYPLLPNHRNNPVDTDHYVVLVGTDGDDFIFNDPADWSSPGYRQKMTAEELTRAWKASKLPLGGFCVGPGTAGLPLIQPTPAPTESSAGQLSDVPQPDAGQPVAQPSPPSAQLSPPAAQATAIVTTGLEGKPAPSATATISPSATTEAEPSLTPTLVPGPSATATSVPTTKPSPSVTATSAPTPAPSQSATATSIPTLVPSPSATATIAPTSLPEEQPSPYDFGAPIKMESEKLLKQLIDRIVTQ